MTQKNCCAVTGLASIILLAAVGGCNQSRTAERASKREEVPLNSIHARSAPIHEYAELRWEFGPNTRRVTFERPGDRMRGVLFGDVLTYLSVPRPSPFNTETPTSSDVLTMLSADGWELVTHTIGTDAADLIGGNAHFVPSPSHRPPTATTRAATSPTAQLPEAVLLPMPELVHTEVWTLRRVARR